MSIIIYKYIYIYTHAYIYACVYIYIYNRQFCVHIFLLILLNCRIDLMI